MAVSFAFPKIIKYSLVSRFVFLLISAFSNLILPDHHSLDAFISPYTSGNVSKWNDVVDIIFEGFTHWDAQHFYHIANYGYTYEHNLAFFPLYPYALSFAGGLLKFFSSGLLNSRSSLLLASFILNLIVFTAAALQLYKLSLQVLLNPSLALKAVFFFCLSPASVFFVSSYTETLYAFLTFSGMYQCSRGNLLWASLYFGFASFTRSNGIINVGFIIHAALFQVYSLCSAKPFLKCSLLLVLLKTVICSGIVIAPYILFQIYSYCLYCSKTISINIPTAVLKFGILNNFVMPGDNVLWCGNLPPLAYSYVQNHYWNVGLFRYYSFKQIPNFLLASPIIFVIAGYAISYLKHYWRLIYLIRYIYIPSFKPNDWRCPRNVSLLPRSAFVYIMHVLFLLIFCILFINVQVTTRLMCSSSPVIYWIASRYFINNPRAFSLPILKIFPFNEISSKPVGKLIKIYFISYCLIGIILFSNNYPWT